MKRWNVVALRDALRRGVQDLVTDSGRPLPFFTAGDTVVKVEPADEGSGIPRRAIRRCRMKGVHLERNKPLQAREAACSMTAPAVAAPLASGFAAHSGVAQMFTPPPPDFWPRLAGGRS